jgi:hypothetical protein
MKARNWLGQRPVLPNCETRAKLTAFFYLRYARSKAAQEEFPAALTPGKIRLRTIAQYPLSGTLALRPGYTHSSSTVNPRAKGTIFDESLGIYPAALVALLKISYLFGLLTSFFFVSCAYQRHGKLILPSKLAIARNYEHPTPSPRIR